MSNKKVVRNFHISNAKDIVLELEEKFLKEGGWKKTCNTPHSYWLWEKAYKGKVLLVQKEVALVMQEWENMMNNPEID